MKKIRVLMGPSEPHEVNIWVHFAELPDGPIVRLLHDYPDLHPAPGWTVRLGPDLLYRVTAVHGDTLCLEVVDG